MTIHGALIALIESIEFDLNGDHLTGTGGHGGLVSNETIKLCGKGRMIINTLERERTENGSNIKSIIQSMKDKSHEQS